MPIRRPATISAPPEPENALASDNQYRHHPTAATISSHPDRRSLPSQIVALQAQALGFRQQLLTATNGGRAAVLAVEDRLCALEIEEACQKAAALRKGMIDESTQLSEGDLAKKVNALMAGIPDPAALAVREDERRYGTPALDRR